MRTAYDDLIEKSIIEEEYNILFTKKGWKKLEKKFNNNLKEFNLMKT